MCGAAARASPEAAPAEGAAQARWGAAAQAAQSHSLAPAAQGHSSITTGEALEIATGEAPSFEVAANEPLSFGASVAREKRRRHGALHIRDIRDALRGDMCHATLAGRRPARIDARMVSAHAALMARALFACETSVEIKRVRCLSREALFAEEVSLEAARSSAHLRGLSREALEADHAALRALLAAARREVESILVEFNAFRLAN
ncbi:hypothetical protein M885DRAFT_564387 [Pelagophyceae sp. CCMP2097]|nr:hypothetical protein M885DRAFT_564387 [Pelagophyceae sp. CCMP2097]